MERWEVGGRRIFVEAGTDCWLIWQVAGHLVTGLDLASFYFV